MSDLATVGQLHVVTLLVEGKGASQHKIQLAFWGKVQKIFTFIPCGPIGPGGPGGPFTERDTQSENLIIINIENTC